jgi:hypothetical protein
MIRGTRLPQRPSSWVTMPPWSGYSPTATPPDVFGVAGATTPAVPLLAVTGMVG